MAKCCCACRKEIRTFDISHILIDTLPEYILCDNCHDALRILPRVNSEQEYENLKARFIPLLRSTQTPKQIKDIFHSADDAYWSRKELGAAYQDAYETAIANLMITTGSTFDGYHVIKYLDIISTEVVFKNSFMNSLLANIDDLFSSLSFREREYTGASGLIDRAKRYVLMRFREKAVNMGANAVLGVDFETTFGSDVVKISINGTAVVIEKTHDFTDN